ncbi:MAG: hypothetical protein KI790_01735 [Cyclobacteriaceae bacterium]|nr:hypothetical protein [Cyclobacteriaceae bacterium HetDA_MAG_MS6]
MENKDRSKEQKGTGYYFDFKEVLFYFFRKKDPNRKPNFNLRMMHGINKISIIMFLVALIIWIFRRVL